MKLPYNIIFCTLCRVIDVMVCILVLGGKKRGENDISKPKWTTMTSSHYIEKAQRHMMAHYRDEILDPEDKYQHLIHASLDLMIASELEAQEKNIVRPTSLD